MNKQCNVGSMPVSDLGMTCVFLITGMLMKTMWVRRRIETDMSCTQLQRSLCNIPPEVAFSKRHQWSGLVCAAERSRRCSWPMERASDTGVAASKASLTTCRCLPFGCFALLVFSATEPRPLILESEQLFFGVSHIVMRTSSAGVKRHHLVFLDMRTRTSFCLMPAHFILAGFHKATSVHMCQTQLQIPVNETL